MRKLQTKSYNGVVKKEVPFMVLRGNILTEVSSNIDFSVPRQPDPFILDLNLIDVFQPTAGCFEADITLKETGITEKVKVT